MRSSKLLVRLEILWAAPLIPSIRIIDARWRGNSVMILSMKYLTQSFPTPLKSALFKAAAVLLFITITLVMTGCAAIGDGVAEVVSFGLIPRNELPSRK